MKVAVVSPYAFDAHGGVQDQVARIVAWLARRGHQAWAVAPGSGGPDGTRHVGGFVSWPANRSRAPIALAPTVPRRVGRAVADADVVHIHEPFMPMVSLGALLVDTPPKVLTFHADPGRVARATYRRLRPLVRRLLRRAGAVTAVSQVAAAPLDGVDRIVPNGVDLERYRPAVERVGGRVVFVGRDDARKGFDVLRRAWTRVGAEHPDATLHAVGMGPGSEGSLRRLGRLSEEDKQAELAAAEVLVAPNRGGESFGIVVLEGLAAGCAVVASDLPAFRAVAGDGAVYVPVGDAGALSHEIGRLLDDEQARQRLASAGRERAERFGSEAVIEGYLSAYEEARIVS